MTVDLPADPRIAEIEDWCARFDEGWTPQQVGRDDIAWLIESVVPYLLAVLRSLRDERDTLAEAAELAVQATLPLLPLTGSWTTGYQVSERISETLAATAEEWANAANAIANLHACAALSAMSEEPPAVREEKR